MKKLGVLVLSTLLLTSSAQAFFWEHSSSVPKSAPAPKPKAKSSKPKSTNSASSSLTCGALGGTAWVCYGDFNNKNRSVIHFRGEFIFFDDPTIIQIRWECDSSKMVKTFNKDGSRSFNFEIHNGDLWAINPSTGSRAGIFLKN